MDLRIKQEVARKVNSVPARFPVFRAADHRTSHRLRRATPPPRRPGQPSIRSVVECRSGFAPVRSRPIRGALSNGLARAEIKAQGARRSGHDSRRMTITRCRSETARRDSRLRSNLLHSARFAASDLARAHQKLRLVCAVQLLETLVHANVAPTEGRGFPIDDNPLPPPAAQDDELPAPIGELQVVARQPQESETDQNLDDQLPPEVAWDLKLAAVSCHLRQKVELVFQ